MSKPPISSANESTKSSSVAFMCSLRKAWITNTPFLLSCLQIHNPRISSPWKKLNCVGHCTLNHRSWGLQIDDSWEPFRSWFKKTWSTNKIAWLHWDISRTYSQDDHPHLLLQRDSQDSHGINHFMCQIAKMQEIHRIKPSLHVTDCEDIR